MPVKKQPKSNNAIRNHKVAGALVRKDLTPGEYKIDPDESKCNDVKKAGKLLSKGIM